jgi:ABC-type bacteriocin/lantibiotic exporter with double-glycine peptidase domain
MQKYLIYLWNLLGTEKKNFINYILIACLNGFIKYSMSVQYIIITYIALKYTFDIYTMIKIIIIGQIISWITALFYGRNLEYITKKQLYFFQFMKKRHYDYIVSKVSSNASYEWILQNSREIEAKLMLTGMDINKITNNFNGLINIFLTMILNILTMLLVNPIISIIVVFVICLMILIVYIREPKSQRLRNNCNIEHAVLNDFVRNFTHTMFDVVVNDESHIYVNQVCEKVKATTIIDAQSIYYDNITYIYSNSITYTVYALSIFLFVYFNKDNLEGYFILFMFIRSTFTSVDYFVLDLMNWYTDLKNFSTNFSKLDNIFQATKSERIKYEQEMLINNYTIKLKKLDFDYNTGDFKMTYNEPKPILFNSKDKVLLDGPSGNGKTTFVKIIRNIKIPTLIDLSIEFSSDYKFKKYKLKNGFGNISESICYCQQNAVAFVQGTIKDIVTCKYDEKLTDEEYNNFVIAVETAEVPKKFYDQMNKYIKHDEVCGGEAQRIKIAKTVYRCLTNKKSILIFDEIDSNLDEESAENIFNNIFELFKNNLVFVIAHSNKIKQLKQFTKHLIIHKGLISLNSI